MYVNTYVRAYYTEILKFTSYSREVTVSTLNTLPLERERYGTGMCNLKTYVQYQYGTVPYRKIKYFHIQRRKISVR